MQLAQLQTRLEKAQSTAVKWLVYMYINNLYVINHVMLLFGNVHY